MKNKTKTYILLIVVAGIWGTIGYKIWDGFAGPNDPVPAEKLTAVFKPEQTATTELFSIETLHRDPFLGTLTAPKPKASIVKKRTPPIVWPSISYQGMIAHKQSKNKLFVITINGQQELLKKGQTHEGVSLVRGNAKHIIVRYKNKRKKVIAQK